MFPIAQNGGLHKANKTKGKSRLGYRGSTHGLLLKMPFIKLDRSVLELTDPHEL